MPASLISAHIRGVRSYSPKPEQTQVIEFMPLTLIVGSNGTGKTTIIEALKFIISGNEPPHSDSRRNFVHDPHGEKKRNSDDHASIELKFRNKDGVLCSAKRVMSAGTSTTTPQISSQYSIGGRTRDVHRLDDWGKIIPILFGLPNQAILNSVILCHQEDNLWCMGDSASVKATFDKIFGCEEYKKEIKHIDDELKTLRKDQERLNKELELHRNQVELKNELTKKIAISEKRLETILRDSKYMVAGLASLEKKQGDLAIIIKNFEARQRDLDKLKVRITSLEDKIASDKENLETLTIKRPAPEVTPTTQQEQPPIKKKPTLDPMAIDLASLAEDFDQMLSLLDKMPHSDDLAKLRRLVEKTLKKVTHIQDKFIVKRDDPPVEAAPVAPVAQTDVSQILEERIRKMRSKTEDSIKKSIEELQHIQKKIESMNEDAVDEAQYEDAKSQVKSMADELLTTRHRVSKMEGEKEQLEVQLKRDRRELSSYSQADYKYSRTMGVIVCDRIIIEDLVKLKTCVEDSITIFHDQMIVKINQLLHRRWRLIYQGKDIDTIELVDEEVKRGKDKKSYNYYMAMRKGGKRMKMREKSSAGQRALAAIILRMTLAELFVKDFAFIALDEPTANLDLANVQALAKSIGVYVKKRSKLGLNVQWIIITHDEQFLRALDEECSPFFYRIRMNPKDKCSEIVKIAYHDSGFMKGDMIEEN